MTGKTSYSLEILMLVLLELLAAAPVCFAQSNDPTNTSTSGQTGTQSSDQSETASERDNDPWQDWRLTITTKKIAHFLDYPSSAVGSLTVLSVQYEQPANSRKKPPKPYENLYYTGERLLGCKLMDDLNITPGTAGTIKVEQANPEDSYAIANAVLRLYLDVSLNRCMTKSVVVPGILFAGVTGAICKQGFHRANVASSSSRLSLRVVSDLDQSTQILRMP
ncbi:MAG TPA: hypothetical protein V6C89_21040 [Drouetiella sp.]|jgi:hypothetical protein